MFQENSRTDLLISFYYFISIYIPTDCCKDKYSFSLENLKTTVQMHSNKADLRNCEFIFQFPKDGSFNRIKLKCEGKCNLVSELTSPRVGEFIVSAENLEMNIK